MLVKFLVKSGSEFLVMSMSTAGQVLVKFLVKSGSEFLVMSMSTAGQVLVKFLVKSGSEFLVIYMSPVWSNKCQFYCYISPALDQEI